MCFFRDDFFVELDKNEVECLVSQNATPYKQSLSGAMSELLVNTSIVYLMRENL